MDDYYAGPDGARRLLSELDVMLQHMLDTLEPVESLRCAIALELSDGQSIELNKTYRQSPRRRRQQA